MPLLSAPAAIMRACLCIGILALGAVLGSASPAHAQSAKRTPSRQKTLKAGAMIRGLLDRPLCEAHFRIGDTISATFGNAPRPGGVLFSGPRTPHFTAVLRRVAPPPEPRTSPDFVLEVSHATFGRVRRNDLRAVFYLDSESANASTGMPPTPCYTSAIVTGLVRRTLRY